MDGEKLDRGVEYADTGEKDDIDPTRGVERVGDGQIETNNNSWAIK